MPPKRKARNAASSTPAPPARARPTGTAKRSISTDDNESEFEPARSTKRARGTASRAAKVDNDFADDLDDYRCAGKPATIEQHLMDQNKKSKEYIQRFKEQVSHGREQLSEALRQCMQSLSPETQTDGDLADIHTTLQNAADSLSPTSNLLFEQTRHLLRLSHAILKCHQATGQDSRAAELTSPRDMWKQDEEGMRKLLEYGKLHAEKVVEGWITPAPAEKGGDEEEENSNQLGDEQEGASEAENLARGLFEWRRKGRDLVGKDGWGVAARKQMVALAGVVRTLPPKGE